MSLVRYIISFTSHACGLQGSDVYIRMCDIISFNRLGMIIGSEVYFFILVVKLSLVFQMTRPLKYGISKIKDVQRL